MTAAARSAPTSAAQPGHRGAIILMCQHFYPEMISTGMHMTELAVALTRRGWLVSTVCAQPSLLLSEANLAVPRAMTYEGITITRVRTIGSHGGLAGRALFGLSFLLTSVARALRLRHGTRGIVLTTNPPFLGLGAWALSRLGVLPYVLIVYDVYPEIASRLGLLKEGSLMERLWQRATRMVLNEAAAVVVIGRDMERIIAAKVRPAQRGRLRLIPNWSDADAVAPVPRERNAFVTEHQLGDRFVVQYAGRMGRTHNLEPLVEAAALLRDRPIVFQLIGDGTKRAALLAWCRQRGLTNVSFLPYQPIERLGEMLSAADLSVVCLERHFTGLSVPSKTYGVMAAGRAILGFLEPDSEIGRTIIERDCGVVLPNPTADAVARLVTELMADRPKLVRMGANGRAAYLHDFTLSQAAERYDACLTDALPAARM
ncbi:MAG TPA: glycosyltransferase family 4 protein [Gemmatimonadales bacterium]